MADKQPRVRRTPEERIKDLEAKITAQQEIVTRAQRKIKELKMKIDAIKNPKPALTYKRVIEKAKEAGMSVDEIAKKLGIEEI